MSEDDLHRFRVDRGGIHCIRSNRSQSLLACSGGRGEDHNVYVLDLKSDKWAARRRGIGHTNWVFTLSWISENAFVTGSRDTTVKLWSPHLTTAFDMQPVSTYDDVHQAKVRGRCASVQVLTAPCASLTRRGTRRCGARALTPIRAAW